MAHVYLVTRAPKYLTDLWVSCVQGNGSQWTRRRLSLCKCNHKKDEHKKEMKCSAKDCACRQFEGMKINNYVQWSIKPIQLWEVQLPEEAIPDFMLWNKIPGDGKQVHDNIFGTKAWMLRKSLKLEPFPRYDKDTLIVQPRILPTDGMTIYGLGIKKDEFKDFPQWDMHQEAL